MRTETRTYEVITSTNCQERHKQRHTAIGRNISTMVGQTKMRRHCKPLNRHSISRWIDGHTIVAPIAIVLLLITARRKTIWKEQDFWNILSITIGTISIYRRLIGAETTRRNARVVYLLRTIVCWRATIWTMRYYSLYMIFWNLPTKPHYTNLWTGVWMAFSRLAGTIWNINSAKKPLPRVAKQTTTNFYPTEHYSTD